jgi:hypothetical protein
LYRSTSRLEGIRQFAILAAVNAPGSVAGSLPQCGRPDVILEGRLVNKKFIPAFFVGLMLGTGSVAAHDLRVRFAAVLSGSCGAILVQAADKSRLVACIGGKLYPCKFEC